MSRLPASRLIGWIKGIGRVRVSVCRPERLRVYIGHDTLAVCRFAGWCRPALKAKVILRPVVAARTGTPDVAALLAELTTWLFEHPFRGPVEWIVGIDHMRYLMLPWDPRLSSRSFCHTLAAALYAQQCPESAVSFSACELRFAPLAFERPRLAALIPSGFVRELGEFSARHHLHTRRIAPTLSEVWDHLLARLKKDNGVLALIDGTRLLRVAYDHGRLASLSVQPFSQQKSPAISGHATLIFPPHRIAMPASGEAPPQGLASDDDAHFAYALCGVRE